MLDLVATEKTKERAKGARRQRPSYTSSGTPEIFLKGSGKKGKNNSPLRRKSGKTKTQVKNFGTNVRKSAGGGGEETGKVVRLSMPQKGTRDSRGKEKYLKVCLSRDGGRRRSKRWQEGPKKTETTGHMSGRKGARLEKIHKEGLKTLRKGVYAK